MKFPYLLIILVVLSPRIIAQKQSPVDLPTLPTGFLKNVGQVRDFNNQPVDFVFYQANIREQQVCITNYGLSLLLARPIKITRIGSNRPGLKQIEHPVPSDSFAVVSYELERIDIVLKNGHINPQNIITKAIGNSPDINIYCDNSKGEANKLHLQNEVLVQNVYPGIDWKIYIQNDSEKMPSLKYDFIVHPGADPSRIKLKYSNNAKLNIAENELIAGAKMGRVKEEKPYSYLQENRRDVHVDYKVEKNTVSFKTGNYNKTHTLVIDPSIFWMTYLPPANHATNYLLLSGNDVETDAAGNIFVQLSASAGTPFPTLNPGNGAYYKDYTSAPNGAMVMCKFTPGGQLLWSTYFGNGVAGRTMTVDKFGNIVAMGMTLDGNVNYPNPNPFIPLLNNGGFFDGVRKKYFITKFSNNGELLWSSYFANFSTYPMDMSYDDKGNIVAVGWSESYMFPVADPGNGAYVINNAQFGHAQTLFISQFDAANRLTWSTRIEGNDYDPYARVCMDKLGNVYVGGQTRSGNYPLVDAGGYFDNSRWGSVITRFNTNRQMTWSTYIPGAFALNDVTVDNNNNLYVVIDRRILKFNTATQLVFERSVTTPRMHFWEKINYDPAYDQLQLLGIMNDTYYLFPTINTACNGSFFNDGQYPQTFGNATGPIFATLTTNGDFTYRSLADWPYEYYDPNEMAIDPQGNTIYIFGDMRNGNYLANPQLTDPGNGAYFEKMCCYTNTRTASLLLKLNPSEINATAQVTAPAGCACTGEINMVPTCGKAPFTYIWSTGDNSQTVSGLCPGNYWVKVTDAGNSSVKINVTIPNPPGSVTAVASSVTPENCDKANGTITIGNIQGGASPFSYSLDDVTYNTASKFTGLDSGSHIVTIKDANGCIFKDTLLISRVKGPSAVFYTAKTSSCITTDGKIEVTNVQNGPSPYQFSLNGGSFNNTGLYSGLAAGTYQLAVSDTAGCSYSTTVTIDQETPATDAGFNAANDHCSQGIGSLQITSITGGTAPYTFSVDSASFVTGTINNLQSGTYPLYIRDAMGCVLKKGPVTITNETGPHAIDFNITNAWCGALTGIVKLNTVSGGSLPYVYAIDDNSPSSLTTFTGIQPGSHNLHVKDAYGCGYTQPFTIDFKPIAKAKILPADTLVCYDENVLITLTGDTDRFKMVRWNVPVQGLSLKLKAIEEQKISVKITDDNDCIIYDTGFIHVKSCKDPEKCISIPNAFTPNIDGKNKTIKPILKGCRVLSLKFSIYNRWGELVFETTKTGNGWDGKYNGISQPNGAYIYVCMYTDENGEKRLLKGTLILVR